ncbi:MAG: peptidoglycan-associated lipoprotein Pal [Proteobacteria bacterium]|nr:peptidoglycan-associated lipoprotein Pal [Pseudomonadota bacterium]
MRLKYWTIFGALFLVAACTTASEELASAGGQGAQARTSVTSQPQDTVRGGTQQDLVVNVGDRIFFDFDKFELRSEARRTLARQADWLRTNPDVTVTVEGHTDERGTREYNIALGERRAVAVKNFLIEQGINATRITTISFGKERPVAVGSSEVSWSQNRRGVTTIN